MNSQDQFKEILRALELEPYATPMSTDDTLVVLARISPNNAQQFGAVEARLLYFIEKALVLAAEADQQSYRIRLSRPFLLKEGKLRFTWDFTLKGDIAAAVEMFRSIQVPKVQLSEIVDVQTQLVAAPRGKVKPVTVGSL